MSIDFPIPFSKMSGSGNDFIIIDHRQSFLDNIDLSDFARAVCRRKFSVGADGLILIEESEKVDFRWHFFNGDGSVAEMCGNGARCAAKFAYMKKIAPAAMRFETIAGIIEAQVVDGAGGSVKIKLTPPADVQLNRTISVDGEEMVVHSINTGVPHAVILVDDAKSAPVVERGRPVRFHPLFMPAGSNVNFVQVLAGNNLHVRTYERGVEDETMACGTGAVASAVAATLLGRVSPPVRVRTSGGEQLVIHFPWPRQDGAEEKDMPAVYLEGAASLIYEGLLHADAVENMV